VNTPWSQQLPECWQAKRLKTIVELKSVRENGSATSENYIGLENIESWTGRLIPTAIKQVQSEEEESETKGMISHFSSGDVLFGKLRPYLAKAHLTKEAGVCTTELLVLKPHENIDGRFLLNVILTHEFISVVNAETFGVKMPRADWDIISNVLIPLPSLSQQRQIADYLDRATQKIDALIAAKKRLLELLAEKRRALITQAVTRGLNADVPLRDSGVEWLGEVPEHWDVPPIYSRYKLLLGKMLDEKRITGANLAPYLRNVDVQWHSINTKNLPQMDFDELERQTYALEVGDILICEGGEAGRTAIWQGDLQECFYQKALHRLRPITDQDHPIFFSFVMEAAVKLGVFAAEGNRSTIQHLTAESLRVFRFPAPPLLEQVQISEYIQSKLEVLDYLYLATEKTIALLQERRTSLISAAVTGQLQIPD
jgi:type I restriction enzyme, S subunit